MHRRTAKKYKLEVSVASTWVAILPFYPKISKSDEFLQFRSDPIEKATCAENYARIHFNHAASSIHDHSMSFVRMTIVVILIQNNSLALVSSRPNAEK